MRDARLNLGQAIAVVLLTLLVPAVLQAEAAECEVAAETHNALLKSAVRIQYERQEGGATNTGHGTAFGVDLSRYGYGGCRYLLSAAHNILDDHKRPFSTLRIEIVEGSRTYWSHCRAVAWDVELDLCLIAAGDDLPRTLKLGRGDLPAGAEIILAGSPRGAPVKLFTGTVTRRFERGTVRSAASIPFDHGDSGGPVVDPATGAVAGVAVAGVPKDGDLDRTIGLFVPLAGIVSFLQANGRGTTVQAAVEADEPVPVPVLPSPLRVVAQADSRREPVPVPAAPAEASAKAPRTEECASGNRRAEPAAAAVSAVTPAAEVVHLAPQPTGIPAPRSGTYVVQWGDNLTRIARQHSVSLEALAKANELRDRNYLQAGMKLVIPE